MPPHSSPQTGHQALAPLLIHVPLVGEKGSSMVVPIYPACTKVQPLLLQLLTPQVLAALLLLLCRSQTVLSTHH